MKLNVTVFGVNGDNPMKPLYYDSKSFFDPVIDQIFNFVSVGFSDAKENTALSDSIYPSSKRLLLSFEPDALSSLKLTFSWITT